MIRSKFYQNSNSVLDIADENHAVNLIGLLALLVDQREVNVQTIRDCSHSENKKNSNY